MTRYEVFLAVPRKKGFAWRAEGVAFHDVTEVLKLADGMNPIISVIRAIDDGIFDGRQLDWGAWIAPVTKATIRRYLDDEGWPIPPAFDELDPDGEYYLVALES